MPMVTRYIIAQQPLTMPTIENRDGQKVRRGPRARFYRGVDGVVWQGWRFKAWQFLTKDEAETARANLETWRPPGDTQALTVEPLRFWGDDDVE
jgi:hypothetical protein